jgi:SPP1 family predicted phage head-tail adaptor
MSVRIGSLRHRVAIQRHNTARTSSGAVSSTGWTDVAGLESVPAAIEALSGRELIAAQAIQSKVSSRIMLRFCDVQPAYRINQNGVIYNIEAILPDATSTREYLTVLVSNGVNEG